MAGEGLLQALLAAVPEAVVLVDAEGRIQRVSRATETLTGLHQAELRGRDLANLLPAAGEGLVDEEETDVRRADGSRRPVRVTLADAGEQGTIVLLHPVEEERRLLQALQSSEERLALAIRGSGEAVWDWDVPSGALASMGLAELLGFEPAAFPATLEFLDSRVHPLDRQQMLANRLAHLRGDAPYDDEFRLEARTGEYRWLRLRGRAMRDPAGRPVRMVGSACDVTDRRLQRGERQRFFSLAERSHDLVAMLGLDGRLVYMNPAGRRLVGFDSPDEALSRGLWDGLSARTRERLAREAIPAVMSSGHWKGEGEVIHLWTRLAHMVAFDMVLLEGAEKGEPPCLGLNGRDVTEPRRAELELREHARALELTRDELVEAKARAEESARAKSVFLATMSHEIRTPMNGVIGMTGLLLGTDLDEEQRDHVETIRQSGEALLAVINDVLDFTRVESGRLALERQAFDLSECVEQALDVLAPMAAAKGLDLAGFLEPGVPERMNGDPARLRQVLVNLVGNAIKFTSVGEVVLSVSAPEAGTVRFEVRDTGIGIPPGVRDRLFEPFVQADDSTSRRFGGSGLGLAISRRLVELMGGRIGVESVPGQGSTFRFALPAGLPAADDAAEEGLDSRPLLGRRILVVEPSEAHLRALDQHLRAQGAEPILARTAEAVGDAPCDLAIVGAPPGADLAGLVASLQQRVAAPLIAYAPPGVRLPSSCAERLARPLRAAQLGRLVAGLLGIVAPGGVAPAAPRLLPPLRILLAEDNAVNVRVLQGLLARLGQRADVAGNGLEVLEALERQDYDLVLLDVHMPELDGLETARRIRARWPDRRLRLTALTASVLPGERQACFDAGMDDFLAKPMRLDDLRQALAAALS